jgi:hypothetical protein
MGLRLFHLAFISMSVVLAGFCAAWAAGMYRVQPDAVYLVGALLSAASAVGLIMYGAAFQRKMRQL